MGNHFFAMLSRMKYVNRWGLMRNTQTENISEHSLDVAIIAHALAVLHNTRFGGQCNPDRAAVLGMFHDATEILTGDMPTPVKYYNPQIQSAYKQVEQVAGKRLLEMLPEDLRPSYRPLLLEEEAPIERRFVKAADKIAAVIKCMEECRVGNREFETARQSLLSAVAAMHLPEADCFIEEFLPSYALTLDEQSRW